MTGKQLNCYFDCSPLDSDEATHFQVKLEFYDPCLSKLGTCVRTILSTALFSYHNLDSCVFWLLWINLNLGNLFCGPLDHWYCRCGFAVYNIADCSGCAIKVFLASNWGMWRWLFGSSTFLSTHIRECKECECLYARGLCDWHWNEFCTVFIILEEEHKYNLRDDLWLFIIIHSLTYSLWARRMTDSQLG